MLALSSPARPALPAVLPAQTLTEWFERSTKKYPNQPGKGHIFVKIRGGEKGEGGAKDDPRAAANMK